MVTAGELEGSGRAPLERDITTEDRRSFCRRQKPDGLLGCLEGSTAGELEELRRQSNTVARCVHPHRNRPVSHPVVEKMRLVIGEPCRRERGRKRVFGHRIRGCAEQRSSEGAGAA